MVDLDEKERRGLDLIGSMMGPPFKEAMQQKVADNDFGTDITRMALSFAFADAWGREGLDRRSKSIAIISVLIAMRQTAELRNHVKIGLANGLEPSELEGLLVQLTPYVGFPAIATATTAVVEALRDAGRDQTTKTSEERGLL